MLKDQDRIFTNLYGMHDRTLAGAQKRGHWDGTAKIIKKGRDWIVDEMKKVRPAWSWRCGFPDGPEMVLYAQGKRWSPILLGR